MEGIMNRREFMAKGITVTLAAAGGGITLPACSRNLRAELMEKDASKSFKSGLSPESRQILYYASLAPSGHNSQPWYVRCLSDREWVIGADSRRRLSVVDKENREVMLALGAFIENLSQAAAAAGFRAEMEILAHDMFSADIARVSLVSARPADIPLERLSSRRTVKSHMLSQQLQSEDLKAFSKAADNRLYYFPAGSRHGQQMARAAAKNFKIQFENDAAMEEARLWTRLSDRDVIKCRDGLTPDGMEITGLAGFYSRHFMSPEDVTGRMFREKAIEKAAAQSKEGAGWLVITSEGTSVSDLIASGRRFQRMALLARERMIAIHPMTQTLEEAHGKTTIKKHHDADMIPQFMLRVGYVNKYPEPVSLRRPVDWFLA